LDSEYHGTKGNKVSFRLILVIIMLAKPGAGSKSFLKSGVKRQFNIILIAKVPH